MNPVKVYASAVNVLSNLNVFWFAAAGAMFEKQEHAKFEAALELCQREIPGKPYPEQVDLAVEDCIFNEIDRVRVYNYAYEKLSDRPDCAKEAAEMHKKLDEAKFEATLAHCQSEHPDKDYLLQLNLALKECLDKGMDKVVVYTCAYNGLAERLRGNLRYAEDVDELHQKLVEAKFDAALAHLPLSPNTDYPTLINLAAEECIGKRMSKVDVYEYAYRKLHKQSTEHHRYAKEAAEMHKKLKAAQAGEIKHR